MKWFLVLAVVLLMPFVAMASHMTSGPSIAVTEVSVMGCGPGTPVYFAGVSNYGTDPDQKCTRLFDKPELQGFYNQPALVTWCDRRTSWNFTKAYNPGDYKMKAINTTSGFLNQKFEEVIFHVPVCDACQ